MKSLTLTASYLWKDIWSGWLERPGSFLSKALVTLLLSGVTAILVVAFALLERDLQNRIESFGVNTIVITETLTSANVRFHQPLATDPFLSPMQQQGHLQVFRSLLIPVQGPGMERITIWVLPEQEFLRLYGPVTATEQPAALLLSTRYPEGGHVPIRLLTTSVGARVVHQLPELRALPPGDKLLVAYGTLPLSAEKVLQEYHLYRTYDGTSTSVRSILQDLERLYQMEQRPQVVLQSSLHYQEQLENLQQRQVLWRAFLALLLGAVLALVLGSLAFLEYQQNQYVNALFRSFGAPSLLIFLRFLAESLIIINLFVLAGVLLVRLFHPVIFGTLEFPASILSGDLSAVYFSSEILFIFLWSNLGGLLSILPVGWMLRKSIGSVLS